MVILFCRDADRDIVIELIGTAVRLRDVETGVLAELHMPL